MQAALDACIVTNMLLVLFFFFFFFSLPCGSFGIVWPND